MSRKKLVFDLKRLNKIVTGLRHIELGVFFDLSNKFLFSETNYYYLFDQEKNNFLSKNDIKKYLLEFGHHPELCDQIISRLFELQILSEKENKVFCPELKHQKRVSENKKRKGVSVIIATQPIVEPQKQEIQQKESVLPFVEEAKKDVLAHLEVEHKEQKHKSEREKQIDSAAQEVLRHLNEKSAKPIGFAINDTNLKPIRTRMKDHPKLTIDHFKKLIDYKCLEWKGRGGSYESNLNPQTLFRPSNFERYLNEAITYFKNRESANEHDLNKYILKNFPNVSTMRLQMTTVECDKIMKLANNDKELIVSQLKYMENRSDLGKFSSVFMTLIHHLEGALKNKIKTNTPIKSGA